MTAKTLLEVLGSADCPIIIDVRSRFEFERGHIQGALHIPFFRISFSKDIPSDRQRMVVLTCEHGPRAQLASSLLRLRGYQNCVLLEGHMHGWRRANLPLERR